MNASNFNDSVANHGEIWNETYNITFDTNHEERLSIGVINSLILFVIGYIGGVSINNIAVGPL